jgi:hypothetical protein
MSKNMLPNISHVSITSIVTEVNHGTFILICDFNVMKYTNPHTFHMQCKERYLQNIHYYAFLGHRQFFSSLFLLYFIQISIQIIYLVKQWHKDKLGNSVSNSCLWSPWSSEIFSNFSWPLKFCSYYLNVIHNLFIWIPTI